jgi:hypothetical protein
MVTEDPVKEVTVPTMVPLISTLTRLISAALAVPESVRISWVRVTPIPVGLDKLACNAVTPALPERLSTVPVKLETTETTAEVGVEVMVGELVDVAEKVGVGDQVGVIELVGVKDKVTVRVGVKVPVSLAVAVTVGVNTSVEVADKVTVGLQTAVGVEE